MAEQVIGLGCDIVNVARIDRMVLRNPDIFRQRILGESERADLGLGMHAHRIAQHVAAKEAFFKALGTGLTGAMRWTDVEISYEKKMPHLVVAGAAKIQMEKIGGNGTKLSLAGDRQFAIATVLLLGEFVSRGACKN